MQFNSDFLTSQKGLELLSKLFHSSGEGIMVFDGHGGVMAMNPRAEEMFGYKEAELAGEKVEKIVPMEHRHHHVAHREKYTTKPSVRSMGLGLDLQGLRKDGTTFPIEISLSYLKQDNKTLVVAFITDISLRKKQEQTLAEQQEKLKEYTTQLELKVKERTRELEQLNMGLQSQIQERKLAENELKKSLQELRKAEKEILKALDRERELSELKSRFVSMASHEFRTPLTTIASSANLIKKYPEADQQPNREKHADRIVNSVRNLTTILNDFLSLEKLESGAVKLHLTEIQLNDLVQEIVQEINMVLKKGQHIVCACDGAGSIRTDANLLKNLLINLLSNASKYSGEGARIDVRCAPTTTGLQIDVQDYGIGIPKHEQKHLFDRFFRAANVTNIQGTGLGLNIVKKYLDLLKGQITFESEEGKGTTFSINIPTILS